MWKLIPLIVMLFAGHSSELQRPRKVEVSKIYGRIEYVDAFADYKIEIVDAFPDLCVEEVDGFADSAGEWEIVQMNPDFTIQKVDAFGDFKVEYVDSFPGPR
jgi:hypothetical protein